MGRTCRPVVLLCVFAEGGMVPGGTWGVVQPSYSLSAGRLPRWAGRGVPGRQRGSFGVMTVVVRAGGWLPFR